MITQLVDARTHERNVSACCEALEVSRSGYYEHCRKDEKPRAQADAALAQMVKSEFEASRGSYGSRRIRYSLRRKGHSHSRQRIVRLMRGQKIKGRQKGRFRPKTTDSQHDGPIAPNLLLDAAKPARPNVVWITDITYIETTEGWRYLSATLDLCTRKVLAWAIADNLETSLCSTTLQQALECERPQTHRLIHHSDRGIQYASKAFRKQLLLSGITQSMSRRANCYDNSTMESFWASYKADCLQDRMHQRQLPTPKQLQTLTFEYMTIIYNTQRLHSSLGYMPPAEFETTLTTHTQSLTSSPN
jgi:putative transposase